VNLPAGTQVRPKSEWESRKADWAHLLVRLGQLTSCAVWLYCLSVLAVVGSLQARTINIRNNCPYNVWIQTLNTQGAVLPDGIVNLGQGASHVYYIPDGIWGGRLWPKTGCDGSGNNCETGQSMAPCGPTGCDPPAETKMEFFFPDFNVGGDTWYDISLVDGYSLPTRISPTSGVGGACVQTDCNIQLNSCPTNENNVGDLRVIKNGRTVECLSPCKKWNYPPPFGLGRPETEWPGTDYCCPTPPIYPEQCRAGAVVSTQYVGLVHSQCPSAYSYAYDDEAGLHNCPIGTSFDIVMCQ
jgi:hypothetical protein